MVYFHSTDRYKHGISIKYTNWDPLMVMRRGKLHLLFARISVHGLKWATIWNKPPLWVWAHVCVWNLLYLNLAKQRMGRGIGNQHWTSSLCRRPAQCSSQMSVSDGFECSGRSMSCLKSGLHLWPNVSKSEELRLWDDPLFLDLLFNSLWSWRNYSTLSWLVGVYVQKFCPNSQL